jgi:hypothetical protein
MSMLDAARRTSQAKIRLLTEITALEQAVRNTVPVMAHTTIGPRLARIDAARTEYNDAAQAQQVLFRESLGRPS